MNWSQVEIETVILDRDGVINKETGNFVKNLNEWQILEGSLDAIARLSKYGYPVFVATNQSGIARGLYTEDTLNQIHQLMLNQVDQTGGEIEAVYFCPHVDSDNCDCRKPKSGLLKQISKNHNIDLSKSIMVGDSIRDLQAGLDAGAHVALVTTDEALIYRLKNEFDAPLNNVPVYCDLAEFANEFLVESFYNKIN